MPEADSIPDPTATDDVYPVVVEVRSGGRAWRYELRAILWEWFDGNANLIYDVPDNNALDGILNMARRHGLSLKSGERR